MSNLLRSLTILLAISLVGGRQLRAQEDPDLNKIMKEAQEMQKQADELNKNNPPANPAETKKKMAEMQAQAQQEVAEMEAKEKAEKEKLQSALKKQLAEPGPVSFPDWTPPTPQFHSDGAATKKIVDDQVKLVQSGTSSLTPEELADGWESDASQKPLNHIRNNNESNGFLSTTMFLSTRTDPVQEVRMHASREPGEKISKVEISSPLPKPEIESE